MRTNITTVLLFSTLFFVPRPSVAEEADQSEPKKAAAVEWLTDYSDAVRAAKEQRKMLLILFSNPQAPERATQYKEDVLQHAELRPVLSDYVLLELSTDATVETATGDCTLLETGPLSEMLGLDGMALADYRDPEAEYYETVVSVFPFLQGQIYDLAKTRIILNLPPGYLTQRTLIYAVRIHPEGPKSTQGRFLSNLGHEARWHSRLMARLRRSGHHQWETRFHRINGQIPRGLTATEVAAESWPGQRLLAAAIECVRCWRLSSGHWRAVRAAHPCYGYDMKKGSNGVWYATGIFGARSQY